MTPEELAQWNSLATSAGDQEGNLSPYSSPSAAQISDSSIVNSGGSSFGPGQMMNIGSSILGAFGALTAGDAQDKAYEYNAQLALQMGEFEVQDLDTAEADTLSTQRAMYAKAGVTMSGSPLDTATHTAYGYEMDKQIATYNAQSKANMDEYMGKMAKSQAQVKAGESLLQGAASLAMAFAG